MKRTRSIDGPDIYDPIDDTEQNEYSIACVMYTCGMDGSSAINMDIDEVYNSIQEHYWHNNDQNRNTESGLTISAGSLVLRRTRSLLLQRLRLSYKNMTISKGLSSNG